MGAAERAAASECEPPGGSELSAAAARRFESLYREALPEVYRYLLHRAGSASAAEDLTQETFMAAVASLKADRQDVSIPWLIGVARYKLIDHYRRAATAEAHRSWQEAPPIPDELVQWHVEPTRDRAIAALEALSGDHRLVLVLRHLDDLSVPEIAALLERSVHAVESLLVRARSAFKRSYLETFDD